MVVDFSISLGNLITVLVFVASLVSLYYKITNKLNLLEQRLDLKVAEIEGDLNGLGKRVHNCVVRIEEVEKGLVAVKSKTS